MQVRYPDFDFTDSVANWGDNVEGVVLINAGGVIPPPIERYMIRVMRRAKAELDPVADADLIADIEIFNKQEGQHFKLHNGYQVMVRDTGYPRITEFEAAFEADLQRFLEEESLAWNLAYCESFESLGSAMAGAFVDGQMADMCGDHGSVPMELWRWHLAEEFEHRSVVHDVLHRLYEPDEAFRLRCDGARFGRAHIADHTARAAAYMHDVNRASMTPGEVKASEGREEAAWLAMGESFGDRLNRVYERDYDPGTYEPPRDYQLYLDRYGAE